MFLTETERTETIKACRFCMMCHVADLGPKFLRRESYTPRGRAAVLSALDMGLIEWDSSVADIMYSTVNDGLLREWCVGNYDHEELVIDARAKLFSKGLAPEEVTSFTDRLKRNPAEGPSSSEILSKAGCTVSPGAELLLFAGCSARQKRPETLIALARLVEKAGLDFQVLDPEPCCGFPLYQLGDWEGAGSFSVELAGAVVKSGAKKVLALDADCLRMLQTRTARFGGDLKGVNVVSSPEFLAGLLKDGRLEVQRKTEKTVAYHDPCALARFCPDLESPREIIKAVTGGEALEINPGGGKAFCCGAGGMLPVYRPEISEMIASRRLGQAAETGADILATGCTRCDLSLSEASEKESAQEFAVTNLIELLAQAVL